MDESEFRAIYSKATEGSLDNLVALSKIDPANPHYNSQIGRVFDAMQNCMNIPRSSTLSLEHFTSAAALRNCLTNLYARNGEVSASLSEGFLRVWPGIWKIIGSTYIPSLKQHTSGAAVRRLARGEIVVVCCVLGHDDHAPNAFDSRLQFSGLGNMEDGS
ncbi:hypothetical protein PILCRDRAFT_825619 [Piloderma croceum F 1598]|uniref:Uncharacterized protein n=1 Tax=Piloderma croceum (strain F 1598) TaxID=765440 RepID=A0A0C3FB39_PILCF|nr:hypothetical protein PILCRDRAFT_825619 [Piloderma croceum F 1598]